MNVPTLRPTDPSELSYPPTLPVEIALAEHRPKDICLAYGIDQPEWDRLRADPVFREDVKRWMIELRRDGMSFRAKARLQSEELLKKSWEMIHDGHDKVPPSVKADLLKFTIRAAGLDGSKDQVAQTSQANALQINIVLT